MDCFVGAKIGNLQRECKFFYRFFQYNSFFNMLTLLFDFRVECYEYLFKIAIEMKKLGLDPERRQLNLIDDIENS